MPLVPMEHDGRLRLLKIGQYRLWHDSHTIMIPTGQSTTKPLTPENVGCNIRAYGEIHNGFLQRPIVDFVNNFPNPKRFDWFSLGIWRDTVNLPVDDPSIDYHDDLGLTKIEAFVNITFAGAGMQGNFNNHVTFHYREGKVWESDTLHFHDYSLAGLNGDFILVCNPLGLHTSQGQNFVTSAALQMTNLPITAIVSKAVVINGNSQMPLLLQNDNEFPVTLENIVINILGGS